MGRQSEKTAKRSTKTNGRGAKKGAKPVAKNARSSGKKAAKSARNPVGKAIRMVHAASIAAAKPSSKMIRTSSPPMQPVATADIVLKSHKYHVGEMVYFTSPTFGRAASTGSYTVVKLLPSESDDYQYRIKSAGEAFERVAKESQLEKM